MNFGLYFLWSEDFLYCPILSNKISGADYANSPMAANHFLSPAAEFLQQCCLCICKKGKLQAMCVGKSLLESLFVFTYTNNFVTCVSQLFLMCLQRTSLGGTTTGVGFRIAVKYNLATVIVACFNFLAVLVYTENLWYFVPDVHLSFFASFIVSAIEIWSKSSFSMSPRCFVSKSRKYHFFSPAKNMAYP